jgi:glycosyltransferase involved in cell wall biosynthesis
MSRVALVYPRANLDTVPCVVGAAEAFAAQDFDVDVFVLTQAGQPAPRFTSPRIRICSLGTEGLAEQSTARLRGLVRGASWLPDAARRPLLGGYRVLGAGLAHGSRLAARARRPGPAAAAYDCVIGVDPDGLALAWSLAHGAPVGYFSLELLLSDEVRTAAEVELKARERQQAQAAAFVIIQDEARGRLLADDNGIPWSRVILVPNAPPGPARRAPNQFWHTRFDLPPEARVALHSGSLGDWTGIADIVASVSDWPEPWVLVVHTRYEAESSTYVDELRQRADPRRVHFSLQPVPRDAYDALIDGADAGLAFYISSDASSFTQQNIQTIGLSSGKVAYYLRAGLPVIVNRAASIAEVLAARGCGIAVEDARGIGSALATVQATPAAFERAACAFFQQELDFDRAFAQVVERVRRPLGQPA